MYTHRCRKREEGRKDGQIIGDQIGGRNFFVGLAIPSFPFQIASVVNDRHTYLTIKE